MVSSVTGRGQSDVVFVQRSDDEGRSWWQVTVAQPFTALSAAVYRAVFWTQQTNHHFEECW